jgi:hypothetical protein
MRFPKYTFAEVKQMQTQGLQKKMVMIAGIGWYIVNVKPNKTNAKESKIPIGTNSVVPIPKEAHANAQSATGIRCVFLFALTSIPLQLHN